jgi:hypothetical protein
VPVVVKLVPHPIIALIVDSFRKDIMCGFGQALTTTYSGPSTSSEMKVVCRNAAIIIPIVLILFIILLIVLGGI